MFKVQLIDNIKITPPKSQSQIYFQFKAHEYQHQGIVDFVGRSRPCRRTPKAIPSLAIQTGERWSRSGFLHIGFSGVL